MNILSPSKEVWLHYRNLPYVVDPFSESPDSIDSLSISSDKIKDSSHGKWWSFLKLKRLEIYSVHF